MDLEPNYAEENRGPKLCSAAAPTAAVKPQCAAGDLQEAAGVDEAWPGPTPRPGSPAGLGLRPQLELVLESPIGIKGVSLWVFLQLLSLIQ